MRTYMMGEAIDVATVGGRTLGRSCRCCGSLCRLTRMMVRRVLAIAGAPATCASVGDVGVAVAVGAGKGQGRGRRGGLLWKRGARSVA